MALLTNLFGLEQIDNNKILDTSLISEEINRELEEYLLEKSKGADSTDGVFEFVEGLSKRIQNEFDKLIGEDSKKTIYQSVDTYLCLVAEHKSWNGRQNQRNPQNCRWNDSENIARTNLTVRQQRRLPDWMTRMRPTTRRQRRTYPYKIKFNLPEQKQVDIRKNGNIIKTINVRHKSKYFNNWFARLF